MDASALPIADGAYDVVVEKGLFDALVAGTGALTEKVHNPPIFSCLAVDLYSLPAIYITYYQRCIKFDDII